MRYFPPLWAIAAGALFTAGCSADGVAVDSQGNLYVATDTYGNGAFIAVYPPGATQPSTEFGKAMSGS